MDINLNKDDHDVIHAYLTEEHRKNGYHGPCLINIERLREIYMPYAEILTSSYLAKLHVLHLTLVKAELDNHKAFLEGLLNGIKKG